MVGRPRAAWTDQAKLCAPQAPAACAGPAPVPAQTGGESGDRTDRLLKLLETANIKLASVVTDVFGVSGLLMLRALVEGRATPSETAQLGALAQEGWRSGAGVGGAARGASSLPPESPASAARPAGQRCGVA